MKRWNTNPARERGNSAVLQPRVPRLHVGLVSRRGTILVVALTALFVVTLLAGAILRGYLQSYRQLRREQDQLQSQWLAESALARALARRKLNANYAGETWKVELTRATGDPATGVATIKIESAGDQAAALQIKVESHFPADDPHGIRAQCVLSILPTGN